jgi:hypothetical protein
MNGRCVHSPIFKNISIPDNTCPASSPAFMFPMVFNECSLAIFFLKGMANIILQLPDKFGKFFLVTVNHAEDLYKKEPPWNNNSGEAKGINKQESLIV